MIIRAWGSAADEREVVIYNHAEDENRIGNCRGPKDKDICVCVGHSGDYFHDYIILRVTKNGTYKKAMRFGAYGFGKTLGKINQKDFYLLLAGEEINLPKKYQKGK